jgi:hypothetical protein
MAWKLGARKYMEVHMLIERPSRIGAMLAVTLAFACSDALVVQSAAHDRASAGTEHTQQVRPRHHHPLVQRERRGPRHAHAVTGYPPRLPSMPYYGAPAYTGPGFVYVPNRGYLDQDCDMPTSTCPNDLRDVQ